MRTQRALFILIAIIFLGTFLSSIAAGGEITFNRTKAMEYAKKFCKDYNHDNYKCWNGEIAECIEDNPWISKDVKGCKNKKTGNLDYCCKDDNGNPENCHVDCANFASQSLIDGGIDFGGCPNATKIGKGDNSGRKGIIGVTNLVTALANGSCFEMVSRDLAVKGDVIYFNKFSHVAIYMGDNKYCGHTEDRCNYDLGSSSVIFFTSRMTINARSVKARRYARLNLKTDAIIAAHVYLKTRESAKPSVI
jgi:hypothetical protein